jgi:hypothetical protein
VALTKPLTGRPWPDPEVRFLPDAKTNTVSEVHHSPSPEWGEDSVIERGAGSDVGTLDGDVIEHRDILTDGGPRQPCQDLAPDTWS